MVDRQLLKALRGLRPPQVKVPRQPKDPEEYRIIEALTPLGDEMVEAYRTGTMSREEALSITNGRRQELESRGIV